MTIAILCWPLIVGAFAWADWYLIERKKIYVNHLLGWILRGIAAIIYGALVFDAQPGWTGVHVLSYEALSFWLIFEPALNIARHKAWDYIGENSALDRFFRNNRGLYYILKVIALGVVIYNIIYLIRL